ncbi:DMT family transporter [Agrobacterium cavarae]|uniref:DMT family transporter n=1 Tax=Agrobacterium cavarae TaxID=2528239 RepID=UPI003FD3D032
MIGTHLLPAGVASVFGSAAPIFLTLFAWIALREPLAMRQVCGIALGFVGLVRMAWFTSHSGGFSTVGAALTLAASGCWAGGSLWARRWRLPADPVVALTTQLVSSTTVLVMATLVSGIYGQTDLSHLPASACWALAFLIFACMLVGYGVFLAVNTDVSPLIANTFNYASPVVALLLSAVLLEGHLTLSRLFAAGVALSGVALMARGSSTRQELPPHGNER